ncbi:hypothetical protein CJP72_14275 [Citrobacter sp. NCU1]|uniref:hypothetical protein n=1 Tax=Citrobacter sp. NCU1 TaxID=2026683 RepID=UPI0013920AFE|nr:hypothetical protein [Citrobacter sp. NCU1]NDO81890.1 hypothetical protein [Citrobacter sp. NCU1]
MKRALSAIAITCLCSACISHPAQYQRLTVSIENNAPCFCFPQDSGLTYPITVYPPTVMKQEGEQWKAISSPGFNTPVVLLNPGACHQWREITWLAGEYDVVLKAKDKNGAIRYAARFELQEETGGQRRIRQNE